MVINIVLIGGRKPNLPYTALLMDWIQAWILFLIFNSCLPTMFFNSCIPCSFGYVNMLSKLYESLKVICLDKLDFQFTFNIDMRSKYSYCNPHTIIMMGVVLFLQFCNIEFFSQTQGATLQNLKLDWQNYYYLWKLWCLLYSIIIRSSVNYLRSHFMMSCYKRRYISLTSYDAIPYELILWRVI